MTKRSLVTIGTEPADVLIERWAESCVECTKRFSDAVDDVLPKAHQAVVEYARVRGIDRIDASSPEIKRIFDRAREDLVLAAAMELPRRYIDRKEFAELPVASSDEVQTKARGSWQYNLLPYGEVWVLFDGILWWPIFDDQADERSN